MRFCAAIFIVLAALPASASSASRRAHGEQLFAASGCRHCHSMGKAEGLRGPDLSGVGRRRSKAQIRRQIVYGSTVMPAFGNILQPSEIRDLIDYLHSCRSKVVNAHAGPDQLRAEAIQ